MTAPWTREQVEAWMNCARPGDDRWFMDLPYGTVMSSREMEIRRAGRRALARYAPECADYDALSRRLYREHGLSWNGETRDEEIAPRVERAVAALWARSTAPEEDAHA